MDERFQRGFKAECENLAMEIRVELGLSPTSSLRPTSLAEHLGIPVWPVTELLDFETRARDIKAALRVLSAFTVTRGNYRAIFYNPYHPPGRTANSLAHELSHVLLEHTPTVAVVDGNRAWDGRQEAEADWLAGALLVPREGALRWLRNGGQMALGSAHFQVSDELFRWRINQTGVARQLRITG